MSDLEAIVMDLLQRVSELEERLAPEEPVSELERQHRAWVVRLHEEESKGV